LIAFMPRYAVACPAAASLLVVSLVLAGCATPEARLRKAFATQSTGVIQLPSGVIEISSELRTAPGAHDLEIVGSGTLLKAASDFRGRAMLVFEGASQIKLRDFSIDGNRDALEKPLAMAPPENAFRVWYPSNGMLFDMVRGLEISRVLISNVVNFPILASRSSGIRIHNVQVDDSGSHNAARRNNASGGILFEEGCTDFEVRDSTFQNILGNALWTHSLLKAPRQEDGRFIANRFNTIGRDAIQVGHASRVRVEDNAGEKIGLPQNAIDVENGATPVGLDTAGDVDHSVYLRNKFEEIDGQCIDLDGFHDGSVIENTCINRALVDHYPYGHFGIVMNDSDPNARSTNIEIKGNTIDGAKFGGLFLVGSGHRVIGNIFRHLNEAHCNENPQVPCIYKKDEPKMLESGIYLSRGTVRAEIDHGNIIRDNQISGYKMDTRCIGAAPGVSLRANTIEGNTCSGEIEKR